MLGMEGKRYKFGWSGKGYEVGGVGVRMKGELCGKVVKIKSMSERGMTVVLVSEVDELRLICGYAPQSGRSL